MNQIKMQCWCGNDRFRIFSSKDGSELEFRCVKCNTSVKVNLSKPEEKKNVLEFNRPL